MRHSVGEMRAFYSSPTYLAILDQEEKMVLDNPANLVSLWQSALKHRRYIADIYISVRGTSKIDLTDSILGRLKLPLGNK